MPVPSRVAWRDGRFRLDSAFRALPGSYADDRLRRGISRLVRRLELRTGLSITAAATSSRDSVHALGIRVRSAGEAVQSPRENESYTLSVDTGSVILVAETVVGALRGLETVLQLVESDSGGWYLPAVQIEDTPRFPWRGLLIDVGRHFEPPEVIKRQLDGMAAVKLNVLHWHLSEDQGFRVESKRYPLLHQKGSDGEYYTQAQIREIVAYARDRGIRVVPEFDMPGHSTAWFVGYPQYASAPGPYRIERRFGVFDPAFDPTRETVYSFLDGFIAEMAPLFPDSYWHIGGDEVAPRQWRENRRIRAFMSAKGFHDNEALQAYFNRRLSAILTNHGKRMVGWDEIFHPGLPASTVVQSWRGQESLMEGARKGFSGILSAGYYLDHMRTSEHHYLVDPLPEGHTLTPEQAARVLGGEACMWHEHVTEASIDSRIWPRMAAIAERFWSRREVRDVADMYRRLNIMRLRLEDLGLNHESHTPRMARRLASGRNTDPLVSLLSLMEPVSFGERGQRQRLTSQTPLVFAVDAARPDPPAHWAMRELATMAVNGDADARARLREAFTAWPALAPAMDALTLRAPLVRDTRPAALALIQVSAIGIEALDQLTRGPASLEWIRARTAALDSLARPQGLLRISVIPAVKQLVRGAGGPVP
jgi:hexosaminidase